MIPLTCHSQMADPSRLFPLLRELNVRGREESVSLIGD